MANVLRVLVVAGQAPRRVALAESVRLCWKPDIVHVQARALLSSDPSNSSADEIFLLDLDTPTRAVAALRFLSDAPAHSGAVALLDNPDVDWVSSAVSSGFNAILTRDATAEELRLALHAAQAGLVLLHSVSALDLASAREPTATLAGSRQRSEGRSEDVRDMKRSFLTDEPGESDRAAESLTMRENQVLRLMSRGLGNKEIAVHLGISEHTVKFHASSILGKLGASSRTEAVSQGIRQGLIPI